MRKKHDEGASAAAPGDEDDVVAPSPPAAAPRPRIVDAAILEDDAALRPRSFDEYVGQSKVVDNLKVFVAAAQRRGEALDHVLFSGPPGIGKTTLAHLIAHALGVPLRAIGAPAIEHKGTLASYLTSLSERGVFFIDEVHRLQPVVEEYLYPAMEDYRLEIPVGDGPNAEMLPIKLPRFSLVAATTRTGLLSAPFLSRFGIVLRLDYYGAAELTEIVRRSAKQARRRASIPPAPRRSAAARAARRASPITC